MRVVLYGSTGMLGVDVASELVARGHDCILGRYPFCDARVREADAVINCIGAIPARVQDRVKMILTNAVIPHQIARFHEKACVIHVSTDCVFSGRRPIGERYGVEDIPDPIDLYGRTKRAGELLEWPHATTVRTSFVGLRHGVLRWALDSAGERVPGWANARWSGSTAREVARSLVALADREPLHRLEHLSYREPCSKLVLLNMIRAIFGVPLDPYPVWEPRINRALAPTLTFQHSLEDALGALAMSYRRGREEPLD